MLYLLDELDPDRRAAFEEQLQRSPQLSEELLRQANLITLLSASPTPELAPASIERHSRWPLIASLIGLAACIALVVFSVRPNGPNHDHTALAKASSTTAVVSEDLLIARAWADGHILVQEIVGDAGLADLDEDEVLAFEEPADIDVTLSWMFIGVSADVGPNGPEATNEG